MKLTILKLQILLLFFTVSIVGCNKSTKINNEEKNPEEKINEEKKPEEGNPYYTLLIGKWKLEKVKEVFVPVPPPPTHDYSQYNIVYEFKTNKVLIVSGEIEKIKRYIGHNPGEHSYSFIYDDNKLGLPNLPYGLKIDNFISWYNITSEELIINDSPVDGYIYYLIKIN